MKTIDAPVDLELLARFAVALVREAKAASPDAPSLPPAVQGWQLLSPLTRRVVQLLCRENWLSREEIAHLLREQADGKLGPLSTELAERGVLESSMRKGYHLAIPSSSDPKQHRREVQAWLLEQDACEDVPQRPVPQPRLYGGRSEGGPLAGVGLPHKDGPGNELSDEQVGQRIAAARAHEIATNGNGNGK